IRATWLVTLLASGSVMGALPAWPLFALLGAGVSFVVVGTFARRIRWPQRAAHVLDAFRELRRSPAELLAVAGWSLGGAAAKVGAAAAVAEALGVGHPFGAALVIVAA